MLAMRPNAPVFALLVALSVACQAADIAATPPPEAFSAVDTSRLMGSPDPLLPFELRPAFPNLTFDKPLALTYVPDGTDRLAVTTQDGVVYLVPNRPDVAPQDVREFLDLKDRVLRTDFEEGLLGLAFHPRFKENGQVFAFYSTKTVEPRGSIVARYRLTADKSRVDPASEEILLKYSKPYGNHDGGSLEFGPDGMLYVGIGDGGLRDDPHGNGQNLEVLLGKILRIDVDHRAPGLNYAIPRDNPFADRGGKVRGEIWALGIRNPWRLSFDMKDGTCWLGDVGQNLFEEIDIIVRGGNYGWSLREGKHPFKSTDAAAAANLIEPIWEYPRTDGRSITGGVVYRGPRLPELAGAYIYGDWVTGRLWALRWNGKAVTANQQITPLGHPTITAIGYDQQGEAIVVATDGLFRIERAAWHQQKSPPFPQRLSETGLFASVADLRPVAGLIPYTVNVPLWSDGADKQRWVALPRAASVATRGDQAWQFPQGTVLVKHFSLPAGKTAPPRRLETRLLVNHVWGWQGYTYVWNDAQTEATLNPAAQTKTFAVESGAAAHEQAWYFPSRSDCNACHTPVAGFVLGLNTRQLDRARPGSPENQLAYFTRLGIFANGAAPSAGTAGKYPDWNDDAAPVKDRVRAYLDVNCALCHQPGAPGLAKVDFRHSTPLDKMNLLGLEPGRGRTGPPDSLLLAPGSAARSEMWHRMRSTGPFRMPPLASNVVDEKAVQLIRRWVDELPASPAQAPKP